MWLVTIVLVIFGITLWELTSTNVARTSRRPIQIIVPGVEYQTYLPLISGNLVPLPDIYGVVLDMNGPVDRAIVRVQTTALASTTGSDGRFILSGLTWPEPVTITAWAPGYYIGCTQIYPSTGQQVTLTLESHTTKDNKNYLWLSAYATSGQDVNCQNCHASTSTTTSNLPFDQWVLDAHSHTAENERFLTMYNGTDTAGNISPVTRYDCSPDYGCVPLPPDPAQPYYGPGYKLDFPNTTGNCAACHLPAAAIDQPYEIDPNRVETVGAEGVGCDFCHKVWDIHLDTATGLPFQRMPGVLSFEFRRPPDGHQFFAGPLDDVAPGEDTFSPLQTESQYCAPCHFGNFWDTLIYNSFGEWLASSYSDPETGKTCQNCHMPSPGTTHFTRLDKGGLIRDPATINSHQMPGAMDKTLLQNAVTMTTTTRVENSKLVVVVRITNDKTGHHVPTDSPLRHLILRVKVTNSSGSPLAQLDGSTIPEWGGIGDPEKGYFAGLPGKAFAKVLEELWTQVSPTGAYWNQTRVLSDNRLAAFATDTSTYTFEAPTEGHAIVNVSLLFRRAYIQLRDWKSWDVPDIVMAQETILTPPSDN